MSRRRLTGRGGVIAAVALAAAAAPVIFSCGEEEGPAGPTPPAFAYRHPDGAEWVYTYQSLEFARYVIAGTYYHPAAGETQKLHEYVIGQNGWEESFVYYLRASGDDVRIYVDAGANQYIVLLKFPLRQGRSWDAGLGLRAKFLATEKVTVSAGTFNCVRVAYTNALGTFTVWWATGVGGWGARNHGWWGLGGEPLLVDLAWYNMPA